MKKRINRTILSAVLLLSLASRWSVSCPSSGPATGYTSSPRALKPRTLATSPITAILYISSHPPYT